MNEEPMVGEEPKTELELVEDELLALLRKRLADGTIKSMDSKIMLDLLERRDSATPKGPPIPGLLKKLPFDLEPPPVK